MKTLLISICLLASSSAFAAEAERTWKDASGKYEVQAAFVAIKGDQVELRKMDGNQILVKTSALCEADRNYLKTIASVEPKVTTACGQPVSWWLSQAFEECDQMSDVSTAIKQMMLWNFVTRLAKSGDVTGAKDKAKKVLDEERLILALVEIASAQHSEGNTEAARSTYLEMFELFESFSKQPSRTPEQIIELTNRIGRAKIDKAATIRILEKRLSMIERLSNNTSRVRRKVIVVGAYASIGEFDEAASIAKSITLKDAQEQAFFSLATQQAEAKEFVGAMESLGHIDSKQYKEQILVAMALATAENGEIQKAKALATAMSNNSVPKVRVLIQIAEAEFALGQRERALATLQGAEMIVDGFGFDENTKDMSMGWIFNALLEMQADDPDWERLIAMAMKRKYSESSLIKIASLQSELGYFEEAQHILEGLEFSPARLPYGRDVVLYALGMLKCRSSDANILNWIGSLKNSYEKVHAYEGVIDGLLPDNDG